MSSAVVMPHKLLSQIGITGELNLIWHRSHESLPGFEPGASRHEVDSQHWTKGLLPPIGPVLRSVIPC